MIGFAGLTHLGFVSSLASADKGFDVIGYDPRKATIDGIAAGRFEVSEPGLESLYARAKPRVTFSADPAALAGCSVVYIAVDVPTSPDGRSDVAPVRELVTSVAQAVRPGTILVILSQVHPGFTRQLTPAVEAFGCTLMYQVETLIFGRAIERALHPERFIVGCADPAAALPSALRSYLDAFGCPVLPMRFESAELAKIAINMFLVSSVSTTNMLAEICEHVGASWSEIAPALRLDARIGPKAYLGPGLGIGGSNLGRDMATVEMLAAEHGTDVELVRAWRSNSRYRRDWALRVLHARMPASTRIIAVWGLAYKEDTHSTFNSPAVELLGALRPFALRVHDPVASRPAALDGFDLTVTASPLEACEGADVLAIMTAWPQFRAVEAHEIARRLRTRLVIDPFGVLPERACGEAGLIALRLGDGTPS
ncbi:MAG: nucleotide sugar dehydrogenase [Acidobacteriota bacterium]